MSGLKGNNMFRRILSKVEDVAAEKAPTFRKGIAERVAASLKENSLERIPGHDVMSFE